MKKTFLSLFASVFLLTGAASALAAWPNDKPINFIVAYAPGGTTDVMARIIANTMEKKLGQKIIVVNKPGAGGEIGFSYLSAAEPDGYTIGMLNVITLLTIPIERNAKYSMQTLVPVADIQTDPVVLAVKADDPVQNLKDLVAEAKAGKKLTFGTGAIGSDKQIGTERFAKMAGIEMQHVPFNGSGPSRTALIGGHVRLAALNISEAKEFADTKQIRILAQMTAGRSDLLPDVPTFKEAGYDVVIASRRGIGAPKGTPRELVDKIAALCKEVVNDPEFQQKAKEGFLTLGYMGPDEYVADLIEQDKMLRQLWQESPWAQKK
ncbi:MAG: tripartite tricarboxylate transporter substrate binding protein [Candidatus Accumulibacter sp.]|jgi:tripartite-type tricarboxylate transporter receptor subunit TctC|nr:tripartite tricarboxylate transporter substrate binding protein [Accumulibacter sp.]